MIKWKFLNCICIFAAAIFILWVGCNEQPVDTEKADGSDSIASIEAPSNSQATLEEPTTESIVTESSVVESEYYPITEGQRYLGVYQIMTRVGTIISILLFVVLGFCIEVIF